MSKIIFLGAPAHGHVNPTLAVVQELTRRGEDVIYYNDQEFQPQIERSGGRFRAYLEGGLTSKKIADTLAEGNLANVSVLALNSAEALLPFILPELELEQPDLVIFDSIAVWGKIATTILGQLAAASITHFVFDLKTGRVTWRETLTMMRQALPQVPHMMSARNRLIQQYGKDAFPPGDPLFPMRDGLNIVFTSRQLQPDLALLDDSFRFVGPSITTRTVENDISLDQLGDSVIYISMGTIHTGEIDLYLTCFQAFRDFPAHFVLAIGQDTQLENLGPIPPNFTVRNFVPQLKVLRHAQVFITHGGMNSVHEGLYYGVPLVVIPHQFEQLLNARCVEARGAALVLNNLVAGKLIQSQQLREALSTVISDSSYRVAAEELQKQLQATGGYIQAADELQGYIANHQRH